MEMIGGQGQTPDGKTIIILGLSKRNLQKLSDGQPLHLTHETHPFIPEGVVFMMFTGETEDEMREQLVGAGIVFGQVEDRR
jgi:hypothetical protein